MTARDGAVALLWVGCVQLGRSSARVAWFGSARERVNRPLGANVGPLMLAMREQEGPPPGRRPPTPPSPNATARTPHASALRATAPRSAPKTGTGRSATPWAGRLLGRRGVDVVGQIP